MGSLTQCENLLYLRIFFQFHDIEIWAKFSYKIKEKVVEFTVEKKTPKSFLNVLSEKDKIFLQKMI